MTDPNRPANPFAAFDADQTVIKPTGGRAARPGAPGQQPAAPAPAAAGQAWGAPPPTAQPWGSAAAPGPTAAAAAAAAPRGTAPEPQVAGIPVTPELPPFASLNPLVQAAAPLLSAAPRLRAMLRHPNPSALRQSLVAAIQQFENSARSQGLPNEQVVAARYMLCTLLDEAASSTPWGGSGAWSAQSLLVQFHNEAWGGEKVFQLLSRLVQTPAQQRNLLELMYAALALGFEGRYRVLDNGRAQLEQIRSGLAQKLAEGRPQPDRSLSPQWQGVAATEPRLRDGIPLWVMGAVLAFVLLGLFVVLRLTLNAQTDASFMALQRLDVKADAALPPPPPPVPAAVPRLAVLLKSDIDAQALEVRDLDDRSIVTIRGDGLFEPGSAELAARSRPVFERIGAALNQVPGVVIVSGHTDDQPIRSIRFPSNWHLSKDRAVSVKTLLAGFVKPERLSSEGRADTEPIADNGSPEGRARNRRVEIMLAASAPPAGN
ncbi:MAG: DotU family type VI secretion system protein [Rubrivivax sp.]